MPVRPLAAVVGLLLTVAGCGGDEATSHGHVPHSVKVFDGAVELTEPVQLTTSQSLRVEVKFYAEDGDELVGLDADHVAAVTFTPVGLATAVVVAGEPFQFDVTASATAATGTFTVGWGHDAPDDLTFGPFHLHVTDPAPVVAFGQGRPETAPGTP